VAEPVRFVSRFGHPSPALWFRLLWRVFPSASGFHAALPGRSPNMPRHRLARIFA